MFHPTSSQAPNIPSSVSPWKGYFHRVGHDPFTDWATVLVAGIILVIIGVLIAANLYFNVAITINGASSEQPFQTTVVKPEVFTSLLKSFDGRAEKYSNILHGYAAPRDPSL